MPKVSVIIPSFNHEKYVAEAIWGVFDQTFQDFEIVITDDGSSDGTVNEILKFSDPRIRFFRFETNQGACIAANNCLKESSGEYIAMLSSDDVFLPEKLQKQVQFLDEHKDIGAVFSYAQIIDEKGDDFSDKEHFYYSIFKQSNRSRHEWMNHFFFRGNCLCHPSALIRRGCYNDVGQYDPRYAQLPDLDFWIRLCQRYEIYIIPENLIRFRVRMNNANTSGYGSDTTARFIWEYTHILENYSSMTSIDEFRKIFPEVNNVYEEMSSRFIPFYLAQLALQVNTNYHVYHNYALNKLYELLGDAGMALELKEKFNFTCSDLIKLTGNCDVFNFKEIYNRDATLKFKEGLLQQRTSELDRKDTILKQRESEIQYIHMLNQKLELDLKERDVVLRQKESSLLAKDDQIRQKEEEISRKEALLKQKDLVIVQKDREIQLHKNYVVDALAEHDLTRLKAIEDSASWKVLKKIQNLVDYHLLPVYTRRSRLIRPLLFTLIKRFSSPSRDLIPVERYNRIQGYTNGGHSLTRGDDIEVVLGDASCDSVKPLDAHREFVLPESLPLFSIVSVLYNKGEQVGFFLEALMRQEYPGNFEVIFVDDESDDDSVKIVRQFIADLQEKGDAGKRCDIRIIENQENMGNCGSRNTGIRNAKGDIIIVIDSDCIVNKDFLSAHAEAYAYDDCDAAVGPFNIETNGQAPFAVLKRYEDDPAKAMFDCVLQDRVNLQSFLNCITRNFSIKRDFIREELFDTAFSYSTDKDSGFGWEDIEMGYRLYTRGARIKFTPRGLSIHISHPSSVDERTKSLRSLKNFRKLFEKHPDLLLVSRRWTLETYQNICRWVEENGHPKNDDRLYLDNMFQRFLPPPFYVKRPKRRLRIVTYRWHCPHQYELYKLPHEFVLIKGIAPGFTNEWDYDQRPLPRNAVFKNYDDVDVNDFDFAILHFDENVLSPQNTNGVLGPEWGINFQWFMKNAHIPKVAICHGTPQFYGQYNMPCDDREVTKVIEHERVKLVDFLGDTPVIVNSHQAQREWRFSKSKVVWQGFDPAEFPPSTFEKGMLTLGEKMKERPHYRGHFVYREVFKKFPLVNLPDSYLVPEPHTKYEKATNAYATAKFRNYANSIRQYSIYFNPTVRSPMPRARGEAMMCGLATVSVNNHDVEMFVKNGVNGFYSNDPDELREYLVYLLKNPDTCRKIGLEGRKTAMDIFNHDRYLKAWEEIMSEVLG
ncbi:MAG TPA: glycosyltransferase [Thermodesulfovibrionales bacterium]|nr:glycosyltransferase [Thermodesulfovibrionales bacterium]